MRIETQRLLRISNLALPLTAGAIATNLMGVIDTLMVGQLGEPALGGVGIAGQLFFLLLAVALGLAASVQALVARRVGEQHLQDTGKFLNAGALLAIIASILLIAFGYGVFPLIFGFITEDQLVRAAGLEYLTTRLPSLLFIAINVAFRAYWVGVSLAKWSMVSIVALSLANIVFNYLLIFGNFGAPQMGVAGAGLGSTMATAVGLAINIVFAFKLARGNGFLRALPERKLIGLMLKIAYPESLRQVIFTAGAVVMYLLIGQIGTQALAAFHVVISICLIAYMPHIGIAGAATTLVGEALGRKDTRDAALWGWQVSWIGLIVLAALGAAVALFPKLLLSFFFTDPQTIAIATLPLQLAVGAHVLDGYTKVFAGALIGAGATQIALRLTLWPQWFLLLPLLAISVSQGYELAAAMGVFLVCTAISGLLFAYTWNREGWSHAI